MNIASYLEHNGDKEMEDASVEEERGPDAVELVGNVAQSEREEPAHVVHARHLVGVVWALFLAKRVGVADCQWRRSNS